MKGKCCSFILERIIQYSEMTFKEKRKFDRYVNESRGPEYAREKRIKRLFARKRVER